MCDFLLLVVRVYCSVAGGRFLFIILGSGSDVYGVNREVTGVEQGSKIACLQHVYGVK